MGQIPTGEIAGALGVETLEVHFQPIVSLRTARPVGLEALLRAYSQGSAVPPQELFARAEKAGLALALERAARSLALEGFALVYRELDDPPFLFLNFSARLVDDKALSPGRIATGCAEAGVDPSRVALEIVESGVEDLRALEAFAGRNRAHGFLISLDDFGTQHSNLERVALVRPDIIKIDRSIISGVAEDPYRRSVLRSVTYLARTVGAFALAEGVERYEDLLAAAVEGVDLAQGYFLGRPTADIEGARDAAATKLAEIQPRLTRDLSGHLMEGASRQQRVIGEIERFLGLLRRAGEPEREEILERLVREVEEVECAYLLEPRGRQITATILDPGLAPESRGAFFRPAEVGEDHSLKDYVYALAALKQERYLTNVYLSHASGRLCRTLTVRFREQQGKELLLCADITGAGAV